MHTVFAKIWHSEMSSFHLSICEVTITMDGVSCLLHFPIMGKILDHERLGREEANEMMVTYLGFDPNEVADIKGACARFKFFEELYKDHLQIDMDIDSDDM